MDEHEPAETSRNSAFWAKLFNPDGRVANTISLMVETEAEAVEKACALALLYRVELWPGKRLVAVMPLQKR